GAQPNWWISQLGPVTAAPAAALRRRSSRSAVITTRRPGSRPARPAISSSPSPRAATTRTAGTGDTRSSTPRARPSTTKMTCGYQRPAAASTPAAGPSLSPAAPPEDASSPGPEGSPGTGPRTPRAASAASSPCSRAMAPARSRHHPSAREPITLAPSTIRVTSMPADDSAPARQPARAHPARRPPSRPRHPAARPPSRPGHPARACALAAAPYSGRMVEATFSDKLSRLRQRRSGPLILELDLSEGIAEEPPGDVVSAVLTMRRPRLGDILDGLRRARADDKVRALVVKIGGRPIGLARVQEARAAIGNFGGSGKATVAWEETFGEFSPGNAAYYLATAFDRIWLQPSGDVGLTGLSLEQWFYRGTMDKLGLEYEVAKRYEYKNAADRLTERGFTGPAREALEQLASSLTGQLTTAVAQRLAVPPAQARELIDDGPYIAEEALERRLVDALGYRDEVYDEARKSAGPGAHLLYLGRYQRARALAERARKLPEPTENVIALIHASGPIRRGRSGRGPLSGGAMGSDGVSTALGAAAADRGVRAIVLRVNSPGGSYVASDTIWREVVRARQAGTPVIVSMGDVAASGGYFISMAANAIVAQPGTVTGSIGVLTGKPVTTSLLERVG